MPKLKNVSPLGELDVPLLDRILDAGEEFDVSDEIAGKLLPQAENYQPADNAARAILDRLTGATDAVQAHEPEPDPQPDEPTDHASDEG